MSAPTEKHREEGERIAFDRFSLTRAFDVDRLLLAGNIAAALAAAEERGMKRGLERAAEIAREEVNDGEYDGMPVWADGEDIAEAILEEITPSHAASSQRATAGSGDHPPLDPAPIHDEASK